MSLDLREICRDLEEDIFRLGWRIESRHEASTGSIYLELSRKRVDLKEWIVLRISDHRQEYKRKGWFIVYSHSPYELSDIDVRELLGKGFGEIGDVF